MNTDNPNAEAPATTDQHELDRDVGEGMLPTANETAAPEAGTGVVKTIAERLAAGETVEHQGLLVKDYSKTEQPSPGGSHVVQEVMDLAHRCGITLDDTMHGLLHSIGKYVDGLHDELYTTLERLGAMRQYVSTDPPIADGVYDNSGSGFREWYVGNKLQIRIASPSLDFLGNSLPLNLRGKWGTKPDLP